MQSNIQSDYQKVNNTDGSISIQFKGSEIGAHDGGTTGCRLFLTLGGAAVAGMMGLGMTVQFFNSQSGDILPWLAGVGFFVGAMVLANKLGMLPKVEVKEEIIVIPQQGIKYRSTQLSFADIRSIGTTVLTTHQNPEGTAFVYAKAMGQEVKLSLHLKPALAETIAEEIRRSSGRDWS